VSLFHEIVLFWDPETAYDEKSPTITSYGKIHIFWVFLEKFPIPKQAFLLFSAAYP
jgi:hypothetical protein